LATRRTRRAPTSHAKGLVVLVSLAPGECTWLVARQRAVLCTAPPAQPSVQRRSRPPAPPLPERVRRPAGAAAHGRPTAGHAPAQRYEGELDKRHPLRVLFDSAVCSISEPVRSLLPLASFVWSARTVVLMLQIFLDPKLGFVGTIVEQHMHMTRARALPLPLALRTGPSWSSTCT